MENHKFITKRKNLFLFFSFFVFVFLSVYFFAFAYSPYYTHPDLTEEIVKLWNLKNNNQGLEISQDEIRLMRQGAIDEDKPARWINHFYDPIHKTGWSGKHFGNKTQEKGLYQGESMAPKPAIASIDWVTNQEYQAAYGRQYGNQTWQKAIKSYIDGDKKSAFIALGHILHLIEDASVPDHTRDDTHADLAGDPGSPYEEYSKEYTNFNKLNIADNLKDKELLNFLTIQSAFEYLANYSNNNFFSADTISNEEFELPDIDNTESRMESIDNERVLFLYDKQKRIYLAVLKNNEKYSINDKFLILPSYFSHLSQEAVLTGASVLDLFFQEVEKYKKNPELLPDIIPDLEEPLSINKATRLAAVNIVDAGDKVITNTKIYTSIVSSFAFSVTAMIANVSKDVIISAQNIFSQPQQIDPLALVANIGQVAQNQNNLEIAAPRASDVGARNDIGEVARNDNKDVDESQSDGRPTSIIPPEGGFPGGDDIVVEIAEPRASDVGARNDIGEVARNDNKEDARNPSERGFVRADDNEKAKEMTQEEIDALVAEVKIKYGLVDAQSLAVTQNQNPAQAVLIGYGGSGPSQIDNQSDENVQNQNQENQSVEVQSPVGQNNSEIATPRASDVGARNDSEAVEPQEPEPPKEPSPTFYLTDYDVRKMNFTLNWSDDNNVIEEWELEYKLAPNFDWEILRSAQNDNEEVVQNDNEEVVQNDSEENSDDSEENSYQFTAKYDDLTYYFRLRGSDADGNQTDWMEKQAEISTKPIAINEIAWRGTEAHHSDEWIELANKTSQEIDLNGWILKTHYGEINLILTGKIAANGFYLLERTADTTILNITADQIYTGALRDAQDQYDKGDSIYLYDNDNNIVDQTRTALSGRGHMERRSSERVNVWSNGNYWNNWLPYSGSGNQDAQDANSNPVFGTPRAQNSQANKYFALNSGVFEGIPTTNQYAIFLKNRGPYMANGSVEATNVEILIEPGASFDFSGFGMLRIHDGGELIAKGTENEKIIMKSSTSDRTVLYFSGAKGELENVEISGGKVVVNNSIIKIANSAIKNANGLLTLQNNSAFDISGSEFSGDNGYNFAGNPYYGEAILIKQSRGKIQNNAIKNNQAHGIYVESLSGVVNISGNNFGSNGLAPIATNGFINLGIDSLNLESNIIGANKALMVYNPFVNDGQTATISNKISYVLYDKAKDNAWYKVGNPEVKARGILKIEPGAVVNFNSKSFLKISGHLEAMGTLELPIIFRLYGDGASYENMVSNIVGTLTQNELNEVDYVKFYDGLEEISNHIQFHDGSELALENVIIRRKFIDRYYNVSYQSYWLVNEPENQNAQEIVL